MRRWRWCAALAMTLAGCGGGAPSTAISPASSVSPTHPTVAINTPVTTILPITLPPTTAKPTRAEQIQRQATAFEGRRASLADAIAKQFGPSTVSSVDRFTFDQETPAIVLDVTSAYRTKANIDDSAWEVTRGLLALWEPATLRAIPDAVPAFRLSVNSNSYRCSAEFMARLGDKLAARAEWDQTCR
jgi:hypothetical protein